MVSTTQVATSFATLLIGGLLIQSQEPAKTTLLLNDQPACHLVVLTYMIVTQLEDSFPARLPGNSSGSSGGPPDEAARTEAPPQPPRMPTVTESAPPPPPPPLSPAAAGPTRDAATPPSPGRGAAGGPLGTQAQRGAPQASASEGTSSGSDRTADQTMEPSQAAARPACCDPVTAPIALYCFRGRSCSPGCRWTAQPCD